MIENYCMRFFLLVSVCGIGMYSLAIFADSLTVSPWTVSKKRSYVDSGNLHHVVFRVPEGKPSQKTFVRKGELLLREGAQATILIAHGYMCSMRDVSFLRWMFPTFNTFVFDFRAH